MKLSLCRNLKDTVSRGSNLLHTGTFMHSRRRHPRLPAVDGHETLMGSPDLVLMVLGWYITSFGVDMPAGLSSVYNSQSDCLETAFT